SKARSKAEQQQNQSAKLPSPVGAGLPAMVAGQSIDLSTDAPWPPKSMWGKSVLLTFALYKSEPL
ncbi:hypothetical protein, partial [Pseudomonas shahriarae]|uniref:hypothetical protein n=1 Tax=Pseudomonas shahriarae TaxID=2745512 RepID=UPI00235ECB19